MDIGYSFSPTNAPMQGQPQQGNANSRLQDAIRILSFKVPSLAAGVRPTGAGLNTPTAFGAALNPALAQNLAALFGALGVPPPGQGPTNPYQGFMGNESRTTMGGSPFQMPTAPQPQGAVPTSASQTVPNFDYRMPRPPAPALTGPALDNPGRASGDRSGGVGGFGGFGRNA